VVTKRLSREARKRLEDLLEGELGAEGAFGDMPLLAAGENKVKLISPEALELAGRLKGVVNMGLYVAKITRDGLALSVEGSQLLAGRIKRGIVELSRGEAERWMMGAPIERETADLPRLVVARMGDVYLGSGRVGRDGKIYPQIPKWRRIPTPEE